MRAGTEKVAAVKKAATEARKQSATEEARLSEPQAIEDLKELAGLLKTETDRWSRQVILAEAAQKLGELERRLKARAS